MTASILSLSFTLRAIPRPPNSFKYSVIAKAPLSLVAAPITAIPFLAKVVAIARPIPRLAPVTSATFLHQS